MARNNEDFDDPELESAKQLKRIADALESIAEEAAMASAALSSIADSGIVIHEAVQP